MALIVLVYALTISIMPFLNTLAFAEFASGIRLNFGLARGLGSLSYALISLALGQLSEHFSVRLFPVVFTLFNACLILVLRQFATGGSVHESTQGPSLSVQGFALRYRRFMFFLIAVVCVNFAHMTINSYLFQIVSAIGGTKQSMGQAIFLAALVELPMMAYFSRVVRRVDCAVLLKVSMIAFALKHILTLMASSMTMLYLAQSLQILAYALFVPASVYYVNQLIPADDRIKGQSLVSAALSVAGIAGALSGGILLEYTTVPTLLLLCALLSVAGAVIACFTIETSRSKSEQQG